MWVSLCFESISKIAQIRIFPASCQHWLDESRAISPSCMLMKWERWSFLGRQLFFLSVKGVKDTRASSSLDCILSTRSNDQRLIAELKYRTTTLLTKIWQGNTMHTTKTEPFWKCGSTAKLCYESTLSEFPDDPMFVNPCVVGCRFKTLCWVHKYNDKINMSNVLHF